MEAKDSKIVIKLLPSLTDFAFLMPIIFLFGRMEGLKSLLGDGDTGWHIRTGEWIAANHGVPAHDIFSYSKPDGVWYAWEWLSDLILAWLNAHGGLASVCLLAIVLISVTFTVLFRLARNKSNALVAIGITMLAAAASSVHWLARPHLFTLLFVAIFLTALERVREGREGGLSTLALLPAATVLWTNLHGGFFVGIVLIAAYGAGELLKFALSPDESGRRAPLLQARNYFLCALACLAASLINPYTFRLHEHIWQYLTDSYQTTHILEFFSISFHHPVAIFFEAMLALGAAAALRSFAKASYTEAVLFAVFGHAGLLAARNIPIFMVIEAPMAAAVLDELLLLLPRCRVAAWLRSAAEKFNRVASELGETDRIGRWHVVSACGLALVAALLFAPHPPEKFRAEFNPKQFPAAAVNTLREDSSARIFTLDQWGDYLIYRLYPRTKVFVDGRSDFYGDDFVEKTLDVLNVKYGWEGTLTGFGVNTILLPPSSPLTGALKESSHWRVVYDDGIALVFRSTRQTGAQPVSALEIAGGSGRDREVTKTQASDRLVTKAKSTT
jgi:hypothetical protein